MEPGQFLRWADRSPSPFDRFGTLSLAFAVLFILVAVGLAVT